MHPATAFIPTAPPRPTALTISHGRTTFCPQRPLRYFHRPSRSRTHRAIIRLHLTPTASAADPHPPQLCNISVILLAGGTGSRMKADRPKQFLTLAGKPVLEHSLRLFTQLPEVSQIILVLAEEFRPNLAPLLETLPLPATFASPGVERQHSVYNGLALVSPTASLVCVHDAARPLVTVAEIRAVCRDAVQHGAAVLGVPSKATIKESADGQFVLRTIPRSRLWEIHTPQVVIPALLRKGFEKVLAEDLAVTDDVSIVEQLGEPVKITQGEYTNIKLTTPEDMNIAESILEQRRHLSISA